MSGANDPGHVPSLPHTPIATPWFTAARGDIGYTLARSCIAAIAGPAGTGKTTTVIACTAKTTVEMRYVALSSGALHKDVVVALHEAVCGQTRRSARTATRTLRKDIVEVLCASSIGVIADEVHYAGESGMLELAQLWEKVARYNGRGFPLYLVGATVLDAIGKNPELSSRVAYPIRMGTLDTNAMIDAVCQLSTRCAASSRKNLQLVDDKIAHGNFREWTKFIDHVEINPTKAGTAISKDEFTDYVDRRTF